MHLPFGLSLTNIASVVATVILGVIAHAVRTPKDSERAQLLTTLADSAAAVVLSLYPNAPWAKLVESVVHMVAGESTVPTQNMKKIENAAVTSLTKLGKTAPQSAAAPK